MTSHCWTQLNFTRLDLLEWIFLSEKREMTKLYPLIRLPIYCSSSIVLIIRLSFVWFVCLFVFLKRTVEIIIHIYGNGWTLFKGFAMCTAGHWTCLEQTVKLSSAPRGQRNREFLTSETTFRDHMTFVFIQLTQPKPCLCPASKPRSDWL